MIDSLFPLYNRGIIISLLLLTKMYHHVYLLLINFIFYVCGVGSSLQLEGIGGLSVS